MTGIEIDRERAALSVGEIYALTCDGDFTLGDEVMTLEAKGLVIFDRTDDDVWPFTHTARGREIARAIPESERLAAAQAYRMGTQP
jgi:hypothetical protein